MVGGYGLFGVIVEAELDIADNLVYQTGRRVLDYKEFPALFAGRDREGCQYRPDVRPPLDRAEHFLRELLLYTYTKVDGTDFKRQPLGEVAASSCGG